jgi:hypothetical protein
MNNIQAFSPLIAVAFLMMTLSACRFDEKHKGADAISVYKENPFYWIYNGSPVLLIGGSAEDNLFNHPKGLEEQLDRLKSAGGNYIRNTMSSRNPGNPWPHKMLENGMYDLSQWNDEYWRRFETLLELCRERDIIVQIEIWDPWDYFKTEAPLGYGPDNVGWESCPYNPLLNINYTAEESGLATDIAYYSGAVPSGHVFFHSVPGLKDIPVILKYQEAFVGKLLSVSLDFPNVLYCMNNEIGEPAEWGEYWARFIRSRANEAGRDVFLTDMRRNSDFTSAEQVKLLHDRVHYDFFEISQNTANNDQRHYDQIMSIRNQVVDQPVPLNNVKIYGGTIGSWTTSVEEGTRRFWRNIFGGLASSRFHREGPSPLFFGAGLSDLAMIHIRSMRMFMDEFSIFTCIPSNHLLTDREPNEAYCLAEEGRQYAIYFPEGGETGLEMSGSAGSANLRWLNITESAWLDTEILDLNRRMTIRTPGEGQWVALIIIR